MLVSKVVLRSNLVMHSIKKIIFYFDLEIKVRAALDCWGTCGKFHPLASSFARQFGASYARLFCQFHLFSS